MDEKTVVNVLNKLDSNIRELISEAMCELLSEMKRKSEKTEKKIKRDDCRSKALYATKKYGCSGIEGSIECLECKFRR